MRLYRMKTKCFALLLSISILCGLWNVPVLAAGNQEEETGFTQTLLGGLDSLFGDVLNSISLKKCLTFYISGMDASGDDFKKGRSDVNIIAVVNRDTKKAIMVSTPRDYFVPLSISNGTRDKLTHAGLYGIDVCVDTMEMLYDREIDYYLRVNFSSLKKIVDVLGGITVHSDYEFECKNAKGYHFKVGDNEMDGKVALAFARERYSFPDGDRQRGKNQMYVIEGILKKLSTIHSTSQLMDLLECTTSAYETNMPFSTIMKLGMAEMFSINDYEIESYSVTGTDGKEIPYSMRQRAYVMYPDMDSVETAKEKMNAICEESEE